MSEEGGIYCHKGWGPRFTDSNGITELGTQSKFNSPDHSYSSANKSGYRIGVDDEELNMLTNKKNGHFTITELEVWQVTFID